MNIDDKNIDFAKGVTGSIDFKGLGVQCLSIYGALLRREEITFGNTPTVKSIAIL